MEITMALLARVRQNAELAKQPRRFARTLWYATTKTADGLPLPPSSLRHLVSGDALESVVDHLEMGRHCAHTVTERLRAKGVDLSRIERALDFGCGCGRTLRHIRRELPHTELNGTDYNPDMVAWCRSHLPFGTFDLNQVEPPLAYPDKHFGLVYAFSVFTHIPERLQLPWIHEISRVLRPGGYFALSLHGIELWMHTRPRRNAQGRPSTIRAVYAGDERVIMDPTLNNRCNTYHPYEYVRDVLARDMPIVDYVPAGVGQDFYLLQKPL